MAQTAQEKAQTALDKRTGRGNAATVSNMLEQQKGAIARALPRHMHADRMVKVAWGCISRNKDLLKCSATSLVRAVVQAAELGLEPSNVLGHCYLIPFKGQATLIVGYKGFIELAARGGQARFRPARVVFDCDHFIWEDGLVQRLEHVPGKREKKSKPTHAYVVVDFANGLPAMLDVMTVDEVETVRAMSKMPNGQAWKGSWVEMAKKTVVRRMAKYVPMSPELQRAAAADEGQELHPDAIEADFALPAEVDPETGEVTEKEEPGTGEGPPPESKPEREPGQEG